MSAFFDTECRQGEREPEDEPVGESLQELLFFDFECRQENGNHEPNLCIVQNEAGDECVFQGDSTRDEFCEWLFTTEHANCTVMAHNFQGYDSSMYGLYGTGSDVTKYLITGSDVITLISCRFTACFPTGSDVTNYLVTGNGVIIVISCRCTACFPTGSDVTTQEVTS